MNLKKASWLIIFAVILAIASYSLFKVVTVEDTEQFISDLEELFSDPASKVDGENGEMSMAAANDFFTKGGTARTGFLLPFTYLEPSSKSLLPYDEFGTYEYDDSLYDWVLVENTPTDGYLFTWEFEDSLGDLHDASFLFDDISYYSGDPDEETPTSLAITLAVDGDDITMFEMTADYETISDPDWGDEYVPVELSVTWTIIDENAITVGYEGHLDADDEMQIDAMHIRFEDFINDVWEDYVVEQLTEETFRWTMENNEEWKVILENEVPTEVTVDEIVIEVVDLTGEIQKYGKHAADLEGTSYMPEMYPDYISYLNAIFPDGTVEPIDIGGATQTGILGLVF